MIDDRLWVTWEIERIVGQGFAWRADAMRMTNGFSRGASGHTRSMRSANRQIKRSIKQWRKEAFAL